jgi:hypothetical protein
MFRDVVLSNTSMASLAKKCCKIVYTDINKVYPCQLMNDECIIGPNIYIHFFTRSPQTRFNTPDLIRPGAVDSFSDPIARVYDRQYVLSIGDIIEEFCTTIKNEALAIKREQDEKSENDPIKNENERKRIYDELAAAGLVDEYSSIQLLHFVFTFERYGMKICYIDSCAQINGASLKYSFCFLRQRMQDLELDFNSYILMTTDNTNTHATSSVDESTIINSSDSNYTRFLVVNKEDIKK